MAKQTKYIFVTGGVLSGIGKGITSASIGNILKARGLRVNIQKCDPYFNVDAGTLNPAEHGECFVTIDGAETDLDLGHYERFINVQLTQKSSLMSGRLLLKLIQDERAGKFIGKTVQVIPHLTNAIQKEIAAAGKGFDVHIVEIGGTVGDYESPAFIEAIREMGLTLGRENYIYVHVVYLPFLGTSQEYKTKPAQNAVRDLRSAGIVPDVLVARSEGQPGEETLQKLSSYAGVSREALVLLPNAETIYEVPLTLEENGIGKFLSKRLDLNAKKPKLNDWSKMVASALNKPKKRVSVGVVAKYLDNQDTYISVFEALKAAAWAAGVGLDIRWVNAEDTQSIKELSNYDGILVPGGFGSRAIEGKIAAAQYALKNKKPYLGLCLGLQVGVIAAARNAGVADANSREFDPNSRHMVIDTMADQLGKEETGGTMRLGDYPCVLASGTIARSIYGKKEIRERHRHRYECNNAFRDKYQEWGIKIAGASPDELLVEMIEGIDHPYFVASQFHPEFNSRPNHPHPMFKGFIEAIIKNRGI
ncbi:CTP synthase [Candidatus Parcubacteria bacterium]|nr:CTP synthase [Candidatus Parcubacteria bacterium]